MELRPKAQIRVANQIARKKHIEDGPFSKSH